MRVMFAVAVLLSGIACIGEAEAQSCDRDCNRCLVYARGECVKRGADPACEARRKKCLERRTGAPKSTTTTAPPPTVRQRQQQIQQQGRPQMPAPTVVPPAPKSVPTVVAPAPKSVPTVIAPAPKSAPTCCTGTEIGTDCCCTGTDCCSTGTPPRTCTSIFARRRHTAALNWCIWRRGPSLQTDAGKSGTTTQDVHCLPRESAATENIA